MKQIVTLVLMFVTMTLSVFAQIDAKFQIRDDAQKVMCYTESEGGMPTKETNVKFKNNSSNAGECMYVWNFGDSSVDSCFVTLDKAADIAHTYMTDGLFTVALYVIDKKAIADSILSSKVLSVAYCSSSSDSVLLNVTMIGSDKKQVVVPMKVASSQFARKTLSGLVEVYSPVVASGANFTYEIVDPSTATSKVGVNSFTYALSVNSELFTPHEQDMWKYHWTILKDSKLCADFVTDSLVTTYTFPSEFFDPGYAVSLQIMLDSTKFNTADIEYYDLSGCVASQTITIPVTDYFFTDSTRKEKDVDERESAVPNVFTPGGNDENDVFYFNTNGIDEFSIWIYNNNGTLQYKQTAKSIYWTGEDNSGHKCPSGTYYYVIKSTNSEKIHNTAGFIHLFRQD